ncbi:MAG: 16S rRNA (cytosine(1402)-N(4))-methyltransferase RsmH [Bacteroidota bacterium]
MSQQPSYHVPVMLNEVLAHLVTTPDGIYVDGTLGGGGHAEKILERLSPHGTLIGIDTDADAIQEAGRRLKHFQSSLQLVHDNTSHIADILRSKQITAIHGLLLDLGVSSFQLDEASKGFSFRGDERLDMRMDRRQSLDAHSVVNTYDEEHFADILWKYGEEQQSRRIARAVARKRETAPIETTGQLASIIESVVGGRFLTKTLARVFQAIRIEVNNELERLQNILHDSLDCMATGGRIVVISYHSLEDRIVKKFFASSAATHIPSGNKFQPDAPRVPELRIITKKPIEASEEEQRINPRSRSAKLRAAERV